MDETPPDRPRRDRSRLPLGDLTQGELGSGRALTRWERRVPTPPVTPDPNPARTPRMNPTLVVVGADKGGVGKTTMSRLLLDYMASRGTPARAFDTEYPRGTLKRFHPDITDVVDLTQTSDQMKIIDTLQDSGAKVSVIDVRAGRLGPTLRTLRDIGFLDAAKDGQFTFCLFHVLGPSISSLEEIATTAPFVADAQYFLVKNHINDTTFFEWDPATHRSYFDKVKSAGEVSVPTLRGKQDRRRRARVPLLRPARLRPHLDPPGRGGVRPHQAHRRSGREA